MNLGQTTQSVWQLNYHRIITILLVVQLGIILYWRVVGGYWPSEVFVSWNGVAPDWANYLHAFRLAVLILQGCLFVGLVGVESLGQGLSRWLRTIIARPVYLTLVIGILGLALFSYFLQPGNIGTSDAHGHIPSAWLVKQSWQEGWPIVFWTNYAEMGGPALQFHNSSYYYLVALVSYLTSTIDDAHEITILLLNVCSAYFAFLFIYQITESRLAALGGAVTWSASFYQYHLVIELARLPAAMFMALLPLQFYFIQRLLRIRFYQPVIVVALGLTISTLIWVHSLYGMLAIGVSLLYAGGNIVLRYRASSGYRPALLTTGMIGLAYSLAVLTAAYQIFPVLVEWKIFSPNPTQSLFEAALLQPLTLENVTSVYSWYGGYLGKTVIGFGLLGAVASFVFRYRPGVVLTGLMASLIFVAFDPFSTWLANLLQPFPLGVTLYSVVAYRIEGFLMFIVLLLAALSGVGIHLLIIVMRRPRNTQWQRVVARERIALLVICIVLAESLYYTIRFNHKYPDGYVDGISELGQLYDVLAQRDDLGKRVLNLQSGANTSFVIPMITGHPSLFGHAQDDSPDSLLSLQLILTRTQNDVEAGALSPETTVLLHQANIGYVISDSSIPEIPEWQKLASTSKSILWQVAGSSPLTLFTDSNTKTLSPLQANVLAHRETNSTVYIEADISADSYVQLAYMYHPNVDVQVDGVPVSVNATSLNFIGLPLSLGHHVIKIRPVLSLLGQWTLAISLVTTGILLVYGLAASWPRRLQ